MNLKSVLMIGATLVFATACNEYKVTETEDGEKYQIHEKGSDKSPQEGDMLVFNLKISSELDSVFTDTWAQGGPINLAAKKGEFKGSFENALFNLHEGDSATIFISADSLFSRIGQPFPAGVPAHSELKFELRLISVKSESEFKDELEDKRLSEAENIAEFVKENMEGAVKMENGIYYLTEKSGNGATVAKGDTVTVSYVGKFFDGNIFDQNTTFTFPVGLGYVIRGWDEALQTMKVGQKSTFVIPSELGYGERGAGASIPPFSPLIFEIELFEIGKK